MKKGLWFLFLLTFCMMMFGAKILFWCAPNPNQEAFWKEIFAKWKTVRPDIEIEWRTIPAAGSSEEAILTSLASGQPPDFCENIFSGFAAQLIEAEQLVDFTQLKGFKELVAKRKMEEALKGWAFQGKHYVFPIYSNPMLMWWRSDILQELGFTAAPRTYSEVLLLAQKFAKPKEKFAIEFLKGRNWWDRWFDFITYYYAASGGSPYIDIAKGKVLFGNEMGTGILKFAYTLFQKGWTALDMMDNPLYTGALAGQLHGPWEMPRAKQIFPNVFPDKIWMSMPPVPDNYPVDKPVYTVADTKGIVIFKNSKNIAAVWEFMQWLYSNDEYDRLWLETTQLPPVRSDLLTNPVFADIFKNNKELAEYAKAIPYAVPPVLSSKTMEIQDAMTQFMTEPLSLLRGTPEEIMKKAVREINNILF